MNPAADRDEGGLQQELEDDVPFPGADGPPDADLHSALVHDEDHDQENAQHPDQEGGSRRDSAQNLDQVHRPALESRHLLQIDDAEIGRDAVHGDGLVRPSLTEGDGSIFP